MDKLVLNEAAGGDGIIRYPNGVEASALDIFKALQYNFGADIVDSEDKVKDFTEEEKQRAINYWVNSMDKADKLYDESLPGEDEARDVFDIAEGPDPETLEGQGWEYVASKYVEDENGFTDVYYWYKKDGNNRFFFSSDVDYGDPEYYDWETEGEEAAKEWFDSYSLKDEEEETQSSLDEATLGDPSLQQSGTLRVNDNTYHYQAKVYDKESSYGIEGSRISKLVIKRDGDIVARYDRGWSTPPIDEETQSALDILLREYAVDREQEVEDTLNDIAARLRVNEPAYRGARTPTFNANAINTSRFPDEMRPKSYDAHVTRDGRIYLHWITQEPFTSIDAEIFKSELSRYFNYVVENSSYNDPVYVDVSVHCCDGSEWGDEKFTLTFQSDDVLDEDLSGILSEEWGDYLKYGNKTISYKDKDIPVRSDSWLDYNNSWLYTVIDKIRFNGGRYEVCKERDVDGGKLFALETIDDLRDESLKEDFYDDDYDDFELAGIYGGDMIYCPICGKRLEYDEDGDQFCPKCEKSAWALAQERRKRDRENSDVESLETDSDGSAIEETTESFNHSSNDYTLTTVGDIMDGEIGNMSDKEIDSDLRMWRKIAKQFTFQPHVEDIAVLILDEGYDPTDYFPYWAGEPRGIKSTNLVYYDVPFFCVKEVKNGKIFLYFSSEYKAKKYVDLIDSGIDLEDQDAIVDWMDKVSDETIAGESLTEALSLDDPVKPCNTEEEKVLITESETDDLTEDDVSNVWSPNEWAVRGEDKLELAMEDPGEIDDSDLEDDPAVDVSDLRAPADPYEREKLQEFGPVAAAVVSAVAPVVADRVLDKILPEDTTSDETEVQGAGKEDDVDESVLNTL